MNNSLLDRLFKLKFSRLKWQLVIGKHGHIVMKAAASSQEKILYLMFSHLSISYHFGDISRGLFLNFVGNRPRPYTSSLIFRILQPTCNRALFHT